MATGRFGKLERVLMDELCALSALLASTQRQNQALTQNDRDAFLLCVREQEEIVAGMADLEETRAGHVSVLAIDLCVPAMSTLLELSRALPEDERIRACERHRELSVLATQISELNRLNEALIRQALVHTQHAVTFIKSEVERHQGMTSRTPGQRSRISSLGILNAKA